MAKRRWLKRRLNSLLPQSAFHRLYDQFQFFFDPSDMRAPSFHFAYDLERGFENYERVSKDEIVKLLPENGTFLDIGANIGMFTVYVSLKRKDVSIFSFEPEKNVFNCLNQTVKSLGNNKIKLFNMAQVQMRKRENSLSLTEMMVVIVSILRFQMVSHMQVTFKTSKLETLIK